ncbi:MAG: hypothetical protein A3A58_00565 [Candidatus Blackburnbacteria bacterium RIFCSPLOWO2_01_FULL_41_27]|uniref:Phosphatidylglycerol lysyltransferase C-terminal domain-containing protein n=2 Tax=Candidatus Blackburniibacteriota TaxID=1817898 RepID=A0A1G1VAI3_9BACT|nr:MAG: hypothetical protein A3F61_00425 [Candidatus Blackburnbacteria bacterium RIFCSPHIGHO2_12_FULL_41_13b]OGY15011.1 MAG: hypothetical protein A3A58_00565 [Candidatus Blackburnbacteria bacterium RIFCSPLOWO2_01_FULL_41_27]
MIDVIKNKLSGIDIKPISEVSLDTIDALFAKEPFPIFEHSSYHVLSYLSYESKVFFLAGEFGQTILVLRDDNFFLFSPLVKDDKEFNQFIECFFEQFNYKKLLIQNISQFWLDSFVNDPIFSIWNLEVHPRSKEEVVYDVELLTELKGKEFAKLRNTRNKFLNKVMHFNAVNSSNLEDVLTVLENWQRYQGFKYSKNRYEKEQFSLRKFAEYFAGLDRFCFEVGYVEEVPLCIVAMHKNNNNVDFGTLYIIKGLNKSEAGGIHGISDAAYCYCFKKAKEMGLKYLNDGELGHEEGTRQHKLRFKPVQFLKSYDVVIGRKNL